LGYWDLDIGDFVPPNSLKHIIQDRRQAMWDGLDKRRFPRLKLPCLVKVYRSRKPTMDFKTCTENIGEGGICVVLGKEISVFSSVHLEIDLKDEGPPAECEGLVVWTVKRKEPEKRSPAQFDTGIEFFNLKDRDRLRIRELVQKASQDQAD
jgi:hypothetical protein